MTTPRPHQPPEQLTKQVLAELQAPHPTPGQPQAPGGLVASDMFTPGRVSSRAVLVWEATTASAPSPLSWHSQKPVQVVFHTGSNKGLQAMGQEYTRQLDRQLQALSTLSAQRLLEGIEAYRTRGREPMSPEVIRDRREFISTVKNELVRNHKFSPTLAQVTTEEIDRALAVLHESDQVIFGPSQPAAGADISLGASRVNSSIGSQNRSVSAVLEQAARAVPEEQRSQVRLNVRAVLTGSRTLAHRLRHGQVSLQARGEPERQATSPRAPYWTPAAMAQAIAAASRGTQTVPAPAPTPGPAPELKPVNMQRPASPASRTPVDAIRLPQEPARNPGNRPSPLTVQRPTAAQPPGAPQQVAPHVRAEVPASTPRTGSVQPPAAASARDQAPSTSKQVVQPGRSPAPRAQVLNAARARAAQILATQKAVSASPPRSLRTTRTTPKPLER